MHVRSSARSPPRCQGRTRFAGVLFRSDPAFPLHDISVPSPPYSALIFKRLPSRPKDRPRGKPLLSSATTWAPDRIIQRPVSHARTLSILAPNTPNHGHPCHDRVDPMHTVHKAAVHCLIPCKVHSIMSMQQTPAVQPEEDVKIFSEPGAT